MASSVCCPSRIFQWLAEQLSVHGRNCPGPYGPHQGLVISLVLVGVRLREVGHCEIKLLTLSEVARDLNAIARPRVCSRQRPATHLGVGLHALRPHELQIERPLHILELPEVVVRAVVGSNPPEENVGGGLSLALADDDALTVV